MPRGLCIVAADRFRHGPGAPQSAMSALAGTVVDYGPYVFPRTVRLFSER